MEPGRSRGALAAARALSAAGWEVGMAYPCGPLAAHSRAVRWRHPLPDLTSDPDGFVRAVDQACEEVGYRLVFGSDDAEVVALTTRREEIRAEVPHAPAGAITRAMDKTSLAGLATRAGLTVPRTFAPDDPDLPDAPLLVKPTLRRRTGAGRSATEPAGGREQARAAAARMTARGEDALLQERVEGLLMALSVVVARDGRVVAAIQQEAELLFPPGTGMSARALTVPVDRSLLERAGRLLDDLDWFGLAQLQFVVARGGEPALIDLNGRFYGSMALAIAAGANLPALWAGLAIGEPPTAEPLLGRPGVRYQWLEGDLRRALSERRGGLVRDVLGVLRPRRGTAGAIWSTRDPGPALRHTLRLGSLAVRRGAGGR